MEEILASIRRIIADDEASKAPRKPPDLSPPPARPGLQRPEVPPASLRSPPASQKERNDLPLGDFDPPKPAGANGRAPAFDLDAPLPAPVRAESERKADAKPHSPVSPTSCSRRPRPSRRNRRLHRAWSPSRRGACSMTAIAVASCPPPPPRRSIPPSTRWPRPCWCRMAAPSRIWCARCCDRCSRLGSTTTSPAWSSGWCGPRSSAFPAGGDRAEQCGLRGQAVRARSRDQSDLRVVLVSGSAELGRNADLVRRPRQQASNHPRCSQLRRR